MVRTRRGSATPALGQREREVATNGIFAMTSRTSRARGHGGLQSCDKRAQARELAMREREKEEEEEEK
jgi:hypothetical protein